MTIAVLQPSSSPRLPLAPARLCDDGAEPGPLAACQCPRCRRDARLWPAYYAAPGTAEGKPFISYECYLESLSDEQAAHLPSSPSGMALRAIRDGRLKLRRQRVHVAGVRFSF